MSIVHFVGKYSMYTTRYIARKKKWKIILLVFHNFVLHWKKKPVKQHQYQNPQKDTCNKPAFWKIYREARMWKCIQSFHSYMCKYFEKCYGIKKYLNFFIPNMTSLNWKLSLNAFKVAVKLYTVQLLVLPFTVSLSIMEKS